VDVEQHYFLERAQNALMIVTEQAKILKFQSLMQMPEVDFLEIQFLKSLGAALREL
jgi:hypothetical protein